MTQAKKQNRVPKGLPPATGTTINQSLQATTPIARILSVKQDRLAAIEAIEKRRKSRVIVYATADRPDVSGTMALDTVPYFYDHLEGMGHQKKIDLFLYTRGGFTLAPTRIVHLLREYCDSLGVLVPRYAHSAGTTLALGANEIVMHRMGELGPIDPSVANGFNPPDPLDTDGQRRIPISVEDVNAYLNLARQQAGVSEEGMADIFRSLTDTLHPLALGNIHRQYLLIRSMAQRLLHQHFDQEKDAERINRILDVLTEKLYFHEYPLSRAEARDYVGLPVTYADADLEREMWVLYTAYANALRFGEPLVDPLNLAAAANVTADSAVIESIGLLHTFRHEGTVQSNVRNGVPEAAMQLRQGWATRS